MSLKRFFGVPPSRWSVVIFGKRLSSFLETCLDDGELRFFEEFDIGKEVSPLDVENGVETALMEALKEAQVSATGDPRLRAIQ